MTITEAKKIGSNAGLKSVGVGILIAQIIMTLLLITDEGFFDAFFWFMDIDFWYHILIGLLFMVICGHFYGQLAGRLILINRWNYFLIGVLAGLALLFTTAFLGSLTGLIEEGFAKIGTEYNPFYDYIFKPVFWISTFGLVPAIFVGLWFGRTIKQKENHTSTVPE